MRAMDPMDPSTDKQADDQAAIRNPRWHRVMPRTLLARVTLMMVVGLAIAQLLTFAAIRYERGQALQALMLGGIERDIASSVAMLDRLPAAERPAWLDRLERPNYRFALDGTVDTPPPRAPELEKFTEIIKTALQPYAVLAVGQVQAMRETVRLQVALGDGSSVFVLARRVPMPVSDWVLWLLLAQLLVLAVCAWLAVRLLTQPLARLASAADQLGPDLKPTLVDERGPTEVARAAAAFNAMQRRMAGYLNERVQILAAISHDLQTPITRMRLRIEMMDQLPEREKFTQDLEDMHSLVKEGVGYARTLSGTGEEARRVDPDTLLESIVNDYADTGRPVSLLGRVGAPVLLRPHALRRIVGNLVDNALQFGTEVQVHLSREGGHLDIAVIDNGPGIPPAHIDAVFQPFYRVESSRNRETGGTGLGLAIAQQLAMSMGATLTLQNLPEGGLAARLRLPM